MPLLNRSFFFAKKVLGVASLSLAVKSHSSIKVCCVSGSRPRGGHVRRGRGRGCAKKGYAEVNGGRGPPPFLHADSELAGVSPAVSAQS